MPSHTVAAPGEPAPCAGKRPTAAAGTARHDNALAGRARRGVARCAGVV